jgi:hypothetical protein
MRIAMVLLVCLWGVPGAEGVEFKDLRPFLPSAKQETEHFIVACDNSQIRQEVATSVESLAGKIWGEVNKKYAKVWADKPIVAVCGSAADYQKAASVTGQGIDYSVPSFNIEGKVRRCIFLSEKDPGLLSDTLPSLLAMHVLETVFGSKESVPHWYRVGLSLRVSSTKAHAARMRCRDAFRSGRRISVLSIVTTSRLEVPKMTHSDLYDVACLCFVDFYIAQVSPEGNKAFVDQVRKGTPVKTAIGAAFKFLFDTPQSLEDAFYRHVDSSGKG